MGYVVKPRGEWPGLRCLFALSEHPGRLAGWPPG